MRFSMETRVTTRKQTILRLDAAFLDRLKYYADRQHKSLNAYVESVLRAEVEKREELPHFPSCPELSSGIKALSGILEGKITQKDLDEDDRLAYLLSR